LPACNPFRLILSHPSTAKAPVPSTLFISDLHLCPSRPQTLRQFLGFLERSTGNAAALYILGDLFEYWAGDDDRGDPFNAAVCAGLKRLSDSGTPIFFLHGNRDFLIGEDFAAASGAALLDEICMVEIGGVATLLLHGDTLCTDDIAYQNFRRQVRSCDWQRRFLEQPLATRKAQIETMRTASESEKKKKGAAIMDVNATALSVLLREHGLPPRLIHGHTHRPALHTFSVDGRPCERWVLAAWEDAPAYLSIDSAGCRSIALGA
jgi:UDP-2,3-diacylglucosamine hydrolase